jgi:dolichol-phosphate mannosyltransferase
MDKEFRISVILLAHNEEENIGRMIRALMESYPEVIADIVAVDDASTDRTAEIIKEASMHYPNVKLVYKAPPCGVGYALKRGLLEVSPSTDYILSMDSDFLDSVPEVRLLIEEAKKGEEAVIGSRFLKESKLIGYARGKWLANRLYHFVSCLLFGLPQRDITNNFKLYKHSLFKTLPLRSNGFAINAETGILPSIFGFRIKEVPVTWAERSAGMGKSKFKVLKVWLDYAVSLLWCLLVKFKVFVGGRRVG